MKFPALSLLAALLVTSAPAAVTLTFDSTTDGFAAVGWNIAKGSPSWSANFGGSLAIHTNVAGWSDPVSVLSLTSTPALQAEFLSALANGGTLSFDYMLSQSDITGYSVATPPGWFELVAIGNSDSAAGGGYDQNVVNGAAGYYGGVPTGPTLKKITLNVAAGAPANDNGALTFGVGSGWNELMIGFNSQGGSFTGATIYIDNLTLSANPAPEPTAPLLTLLTLAGMLTRRTRR